MTINDIPHLAAILLESHGLAGLGWKFEWDRAVRGAGACWHGRRTISLSRAYAELNAAGNPDEVFDTILHEVAHALVDADHRHDEVWKAACVRVGAVPRACCDPAEVAMPQGRYLATCPGCGAVCSRHKVPPSNRHIYHRRCGPERGRLTYHDTESIKSTIAETAKLMQVQAPTSAPRPNRMR
jgi:predicted SprT family Zn-dependent metalloprotease